MTMKTTLAFAAAFALFTTPAMAQNRTKAPVKASSKTSSKTRAAAPGVHVVGKTSAFATSRARLATSGSASLTALRATRKAKGKALGSKVDVLYIKLGDIEGESTKLGRALKGGPKAGKTKTARELVSKIESRAVAARTHVAVAKKAIAKNDAAVTQRALAAAEVEVRAIDELASKLGLLEPIISR